MATYTPTLGLELITPGSQAGLWGNTTNNSLNLIDQAIAGVTPISLASASGSTYTLTDFNGALDESRSAVLNIIGTAIGSNTVVVPNKQKTYLVRNATGQDVVFRTATPTATYTVGPGFSILIFCDGNNNVFTGIASPNTGTLSVSGGGTGATTFTAGILRSSGGTNALTTTATVNAATELANAVPVANGGTGQTTLTSGAMLIGNGAGNVAVLSGSSAGQVATWNGSTWTAAAAASAGVTSFNSRTGAVTLSSSDVTGALGYTPASLSATQSWSGTNTFFTGSTYPVRVTGGAGATLSIGGSNVATSSSTFEVVVSSSITALRVTSAGTYNATGVYGTISDIRKKENIEPSRNYLEDINKVNVVKYSLKEEQSPVPTKLGVIAQELEQVFPGLIDNSDPEEKSVKMSIFIPMLIKSVQELSAQVESLKAEVEILKAAK